MANQRIDFSQLGGFPLTQDALDYMQQSYQKAIIGLAQLAGDMVIVSGMVDNGTAITDGWIVANGDLIPFKGGNKQTYFVITETGTPLQFQDDSVKTVLFTKSAYFGSGAGQIAYSSLIRLSTVLQLNSNLATLQNQVNNLAGFVPQGLISMWSGAITAIPAGWALCDGTQGTPNLKGKFIVGYDDTDFDYNGIGRTGGEKKHSLTIPELPIVTPQWKNNYGQNNDVFDGRDGTVYSIPKSGQTPPLKNQASVDTSPIVPFGGNQAHENRPPYYTLAYIMKL